ncbi:hypothetical protein L1887_33335 [Cichorium endivia]|nr:hypothetical protein L1887_33335 [Cichorium endivia]
MGKQTRSKKSVSAIGKGKVTPVQVAFIIDRYDNKFVRTRSAFRSEASHLIPKSLVNEENMEFRSTLYHHTLSLDKLFGFPKRSTGSGGSKVNEQGEVVMFSDVAGIDKAKEEFEEIVVSLLPL